LNRKPIPETISYLLGQVCRAHRGYANDVLTDIGLYAGQEMFLLHLWEQDGLTQSQLVEHMCVQPATVSKMLDRMEKAGLVTRRPDSEDSRVSRVYSTEQGRILQNAVADVWDKLEERTIAGFSTEERLLLRRLLLQVHENLSDS
jgi:MarR family transcriptional regulator, organic hydroperoxide resistance regulator